MPDISSSSPRLLVVVRAGKRSLHAGWIGLEGRQDFTLAVAAYERLDESPLYPNVNYRDILGNKIRGYSRLFESEPALLEDYTHIALIDDDIRTDALDIGRCFQAGIEHGLEIWQPSLTWDSHFSYAVVLRNPVTHLRYCNFIEMMCPFFTVAALRRALPLFSLGHETGIDRFWCCLSDDPAFKYAVIDSVTVTHTRPIGTTARQQGFENGYDEAFAAIGKEFGAAFHGPVVYGGVLKGGLRFTSRILAAMISTLAAGAILCTPVGKIFGSMRLLDHIRHNLTRPINNDRISL
jgi:hypothetical protein